LLDERSDERGTQAMVQARTHPLDA